MMYVVLRTDVYADYREAETDSIEGIFTDREIAEGYKQKKEEQVRARWEADLKADGEDPADYDIDEDPAVPNFRINEYELNPRA